MIFKNQSTALPIADSLRAKIDSVVLYDAFILHVYFSHPMDSASATALSHYRLQPGNITPDSILPNANQSRKWTLLFSDSFLFRTYYRISISQLFDQTGQAMTDTSMSFFRYLSSRNDILIHEIMADPEPRNELPEVEWIELINASPFPININGWRIGKTNSRSGPLPNFILMPDSLLLVCSSGSISQLVQYGNARSVSYFPALSNAGDDLFLSDDKGKTIHTISYRDYWHENGVKKSGGWTLEMKDQKNPCAGNDNWSSSIDVLGGTPGKRNSIRQNNPDIHPPQSVRCYVSEPQKICLMFNETLDSSMALHPLKYHLVDEDIFITDVSFKNHKQDEVILRLSRVLDSGRIYTLQYDDMEDCVRNHSGLSDLIKLGLKKIADSSDLVVNEILFNPRAGGSDMVELYNRSNHVIDLNDCFLAHLDETGAMGDIISVSENPLPLLPQEYLAITTDKNSLLREYTSVNPGRIFEISDMPSYGDDEGTVVLLNRNGDIIDKVHYLESWHFPLLNDKEGVSLERLDFHGESQQPKNWHSASSVCGFATPGIKNSQSVGALSATGSFRLNSKWMSPNNDGKEDQLVLQYKFETPGNVLQAFIYDAGGKLLHRWLRAELCGMSGQLFWNGMLEGGRKVGYGAYVLFVESYNAEGKINREKLAFYVGE